MHAIADAALELAEEHALTHALSAALEGAGPSLVLAGMRCRDRRATAVVANGCAAHARLPMPVGCLAKVLTAALAQALLERADVALDTSLPGVLPAARGSARLERVTLAQLLEHTHGLDGSAIDARELLASASDAAGLVRRATAAQPLARPGALYSYGSVGAWLVAAALEALAGKPYAALLSAELRAWGACAERRARGGDARICAATGAGLELSVDDWLAILAKAATRVEWPVDGGARLLRAVTPLPGWNPLERGAYLGWKFHGNGWFGHQSAWPRSSALVRVHPRREIAIVLIAREHAASVVAARAFGRCLPELFELRAPRAIAWPPAAELRPYCARYASAAWDVQALLDRDRLVLHVHDRLGSHAARVELAPAAEHTFFSRPPIEGFPYVQFVRGEDGELGGYLWNGRFVLRRL